MTDVRSRRTRSRSAERSRAGGYSLVGLMAAVTILLILMSAAVPTWRYVMKDDREEELIFRGKQIAYAVDKFRKDAKHGGTFPTSMEVLVRGKYLRGTVEGFQKRWGDPMMPDGKWRLLPPGTGAVVTIGASPSPSPSPSPGGSGGQYVGPFAGVASRSTEKGLRIVNGRQRYNEWVFIAGQEVLVGWQNKARRLGGVPIGSPSPRGSPK